VNVAAIRLILRLACVAKTVVSKQLPETPTDILSQSGRLLKTSHFVIQQRRITPRMPAKMPGGTSPMIVG
jgi:hypothetical protein